MGSFPMHISSQGSLTHIISSIFIPLHVSSQGSLTHNIHGIFIPLHISSQGTYSHCIAYLRSLSYCIVTTYQGISILLHIMGSQSHCIAYRDLYPTSHLIPRSSPHSYHEISISMHISHI